MRRRRDGLSFIVVKDLSKRIEASEYAVGDRIPITGDANVEMRVGIATRRRDVHSLRRELIERHPSEALYEQSLCLRHCVR